jgi:putative restriction endonuclease
MPERGDIFLSNPATSLWELTRTGCRTYDSDIDRDYEDRLRAAAMAWLDERVAAGHEVLPFRELAEFSSDGRWAPLMDCERGIRRPAHMEAALSIRTSFTPGGQVPPYEDTERPDGLLRYKYRGVDGDHPENVALRRAFEERLPLVWFVAGNVALFSDR